MSTGPGLGYHIVDKGDAATLPGSLQTNRRLSQWLRLRPDGIVEVFSGKVEIGQGILTAVAQIVADELDVDLARVRMVPASTAMSPNEGVTSGSLSVEHSGSALRYACAEARAIYLDAAAQRLGVAAQSLEIARRHHRRARQSAAPATGSWPTTICSSATPPRTLRPSPRLRGGWRARLPPASTSPTRCSAGRASSTTSCCPACCTGACCDRRRRARRSRRWTRRPPKTCRASWPWCATAALSAWWRRPRMRRTLA